MSFLDWWRRVIPFGRRSEIDGAAHLRSLGFRVCRVRHHDLAVAAGGSSPASLARLEIGRDELPRALEPDLRERIIDEIREVGDQHVTIDPQGYRMGSLNEGLQLKPI